MAFVISGIKQDKTVSIPVDLLVLFPSPDVVRQLLEKYAILILSMDEYDKEPKDFGDVRTKVKRGQETITIISSFPNISAACRFFILSGFDIVDLNSYTIPVPPSNITALIEETRKSVKSESEVQQSLQDAQAMYEKNIYRDPRLGGAQEVCEWIVSHSAKLLPRLEAYVDARDIKKFQIKQDVLKKLKLGNNYEKIKELGVEVLKIMQNWEELFFEKQKVSAQLMIPNSILTDVDLTLQDTRKLYTLQRKKLGAAISWIQDDYAFFGDFGLLRKFFQNDFLHQLVQPQKWMYYLYDWFNFCIGFLLSLSGVWYIYHTIFQTSANLESFWTQMTKVGILGLLLWVGSFFIVKNIKNLLIVYGLTILAYLLIHSFVVTNFAL